MAHYGDPEAHRCILEEVAARPAAPRLIAYLRAAVMGSQGSDVGLQQLRRFPGAVELPGPHLKVTLALLLMTVLASAAKPAYRREQQRVAEMLARERAVLVQQGEQLKADIGGSTMSASAPQPTPGHLASCDLGGPTTNAAAAAVTGGSSLSTPLPNSGVGEVEAEELRTPLQRWEQSMDILNYCEAYANYLHGFTVLWYELFGPHYYYDCDGAGGGGTSSPGLSSDSGEREAGAAAARMMRPGSGEWASSSAPSSPPVSGPQVPPHLYAVRWAEILTPQRRAWFQGLHNVVKEILVRILCRELPLELYALLIQYANLSLRVYLLQTLAEVFEWTSHYLDVLCYVHVMRRSYGVQCEMSELQRIWASFNLFDNRFIDDCRVFNKMYTESQGAFSEQQVMVGPIRAGSAGATATTAATTAAAAAATTAATANGALQNRLPPRLGMAATLSSDCARSSQHSPDSNEEEGSTASPSTGTSLHGGPERAARGATSPLPAVSEAEGRLSGIHRIFPLRGTMGNTSSDAADAAPSDTSSSSDDEALSSASETGGAAGLPGAGGARRTKRAVYLPLFYTSCCFTWILQRTFWSMYGRTSLLLESCLGNEVTPQVLRVGVKGVGAGESAALFNATLLGARRRGVAAAAAAGANGTGAVTVANPRVSGVGGSARWLAHTPTATGTLAAGLSGSSSGGVGGGDRRGGGSGGGGAVSPSLMSAAANSLSSSTTAEGAALSATTVSRSGRPPHASAVTPPDLHTPASAAAAPASAASAVAAAEMMPVAAAAAAPSGSRDAAPAVPALTPAAGSAAASEGARGAPSAVSAGWASLLGRLARLRHPRSAGGVVQGENSRSVDALAGAVLPLATSPLSSPPHATAVSTALPANVAAESSALSPFQQEEEEDDEEARAALSTLLTTSGAPFHLQYTHRAREVQLYVDPSVTFTGSGSGSDADTLFFEEFHFLRGTGCYVMSHALRNLTCYPRYPVTLLILTDNTHRPGRVAWCDHKFSVLSSPAEDREERRGLTPWVLCAVIPHTRLSSDDTMRARQEERLLQHVVFQVAGARSPRVRFCTANSVFYVLNGGVNMDGGRLYFALHLHVPGSVSEGGSAVPERVMQEESKWAFRELGELHCSWAMPCTCNEAIRVAFQVGPIDGVQA